MLPRAELYAPTGAHHGEGPFWDERGDRLLFVDLLAGEIVAVDAEARASRHRVPSRVVSVLRRRTVGGFAVATERGVSVTDDMFSEFREISSLTEDSTLRTNDGGCDPLGGFIVGTMAYDQRPGVGSVYRVSGPGEPTMILGGVTISNGVQWSADGTRVFYVDTPTRRVDVFDVDQATGAWSGRREHLRLDRVDGMPDGMAIDDQDGLWIAMWGAGAVHHYDPAGRLVDVITVPGVKQVSSCAFGGADRRTLFITTSREGLRKSAEPLAGAIFALQTNHRGAVPAPFAG